MEEEEERKAAEEEESRIPRAPTPLRGWSASAKDVIT